MIQVPNCPNYVLYRFFDLVPNYFQTPLIQNSSLTYFLTLTFLRHSGQLSCINSHNLDLPDCFLTISEKR